MLVGMPRDLCDAKTRRGAPLLLGLPILDYLHRKLVVVLRLLLHFCGYPVESTGKAVVIHLVVLRDLPFHALRAGAHRAVRTLTRCAGCTRSPDGGALGVTGAHGS